MQDLRFAALIRQKDPYMINWSNVPDYLEKNAFISFAKACSSDDTIHFVTFINWVYYVSNNLHFFSVCFIILPTLNGKAPSCFKCHELN